MSTTDQMIKSSQFAAPRPSVCPHKHILAAGTAAALSTIAVQPLDVLKTRLQVSSLPKYHQGPVRGITRNLRNIFVAEGVRGLYRGLFPSLISVVPSISIYFTLYCEIKCAFGVKAQDGSAKTAGLQALSAGLASCMTAAITNPLWVVKARMQTQPHSRYTAPKYHNTFHAMHTIAKDEGVRALYKGLGASMLNSTQAMIQFPIYEKLKLVMCKRFDTDCPHAALCYLASSAIAASFASIITYPSEVVRSRMQVQGMQLHGLHVQGFHRAIPRSYMGTFSAFRTIFYEEGLRGMYRGMLTNLVRLVPAQAISFTVYEVILRIFNIAH